MNSTVASNRAVEHGVNGTGVVPVTPQCSVACASFGFTPPTIWVPYSCIRSVQKVPCLPVMPCMSTRSVWRMIMVFSQGVGLAAEAAGMEIGEKIVSVVSQGSEAIQPAKFEAIQPESCVFTLWPPLKNLDVDSARALPSRGNSRGDRFVHGRVSVYALSFLQHRTRLRSPGAVDRRRRTGSVGLSSSMAFSTPSVITSVRAKAPQKFTTRLLTRGLSRTSFRPGVALV